MERAVLLKRPDQICSNSVSLTVLCIYFEWRAEERQGGAERVRWANDMQQRGCWVELNPGQLQQVCSTTLYDVHGSVNSRGSIKRFSDRALPTAASDLVQTHSNGHLLPLPYRWAKMSFSVYNFPSFSPSLHAVLARRGQLHIVSIVAFAILISYMFMSWYRYRYDSDIFSPSTVWQPLREEKKNPTRWRISHLQPVLLSQAAAAEIYKQALALQRPTACIAAALSWVSEMCKTWVTSHTHTNTGNLNRNKGPEKGPPARNAIPSLLWPVNWRKSCRDWKVGRLQLMTTSLQSSWKTYKKIKFYTWTILIILLN